MQLSGTESCLYMFTNNAQLHTHTTKHTHKQKVTNKHTQSHDYKIDISCSVAANSDDDYHKWHRQPQRDGKPNLAPYRNRNRKLLISRAPTKAKSQEPAYSQALNQNK